MRDARYEAWLQRENVSWAYLPSVAVDSLDLKASLRLQARLDAKLTPDKVERYAAEMREQGFYDFPAVILCYPSERTDGKAHLITGNHRAAAAVQAGITHVDAYHVVTADTDLYVRDLLVRTANVVEGDSISTEERMAQGVHLLAQYNRSAEEVAKALRISASTLSERYRQKRSYERLAKLGVPVQKLSSSVVSRLFALRNDPVLAEAAGAIAQTRMSVAEAGQIVSQINAYASQDEQLAFLARFKNTPAYQRSVRDTRGGAAPGPLHRRSLFIHLNALERFLEGKNLGQLGITDRDTYEQFCRDSIKLSEKLLALRQAYLGGKTQEGAAGASPARAPRQESPAPEPATR